MRLTNAISMLRPVLVALLLAGPVLAGCESSGTMSRVGTNMRHAVNFSGVPPQTEPMIDDDPPKRTR